MLTDDAQTDVQHSDMGTMSAHGGYRMWPTKKSTLGSVKQGISAKIDVSYGAAVQSV